LPHFFCERLNRNRRVGRFQIISPALGLFWHDGAMQTMFEFRDANDNFRFGVFFMKLSEH